MVQYKEMKNKISQALVARQLELADELIDKYEEVAESDLDLYSLRANYYCSKGELVEAEEILIKACEQSKFNFDSNYNLAIMYDMQGKDELAWRQYTECVLLAKNEEQRELGGQAIEYMLNKIESYGNKRRAKELALRLQKITDEVVIEHNTVDREFPYSGDKSLIGKQVDDYYIGIYDDFKVQRDRIEFLSKFHSLTKVEILPLNKTKRIQGDYIVPIATNIPDTLVTIKRNQEQEQFKLVYANRFYYFRITPDMEIERNKDVIIGKPVHVHKKKDIKDLVLTIFVDGLSQEVLQNYGVKELMPNTYEFFKEGTICKNTYVSGEWTYVSMGSFYTGQYTTKHKLFHPNKNAKLSDKTRILSEGFQDAGYITAKIDGDWRSSANIGYARGFDRTIYQPSVRSMDAPDVIHDVMEHMETFKENNQFIWMCVPDLHDIADGYELPVSIQVQEVFGEKPNNVKYDSGLTSVRQNFNEGKKTRYIKQIKRIDTYLDTLYNYIEKNFDMDQVTVALIADHGQGYLIPEGQPMLSNERIKVPLMVRSKEIKSSESGELIQGLDLMSVLYQLGNVNENTIHLDTNLPVAFGGNKEREYTYSESIFPGAVYAARITMKDAIFYYETLDKVQEDGRVNMNEYSGTLVDIQEDRVIEDEERIQRLLDIVYEHMKYYRIYE